MSVAPEHHDHVDSRHDHRDGSRPTTRPDLRVVGPPLAEPPAPGPTAVLAAPVLRLRRLPHPSPAPWDPAAPAIGGTAGAAGALQGAFVLHALAGGSTTQTAFEDAVATPVTELPCPEDLARRLVQAVVDVVRGHRPASQVLRWTTPEVYSQLRQRARLEQAHVRPGGRRPVVRSLRTHPGGPHGIEVSAVVLDGSRARAVAARLDGEDSRWRLTALAIG